MTRSDGLLDRLKDPSGLQGLFDPNLDPILDPYIFRHAHLGVYVGGLKDPPRGLKDPLTSKRSLLVWEARADLVRAPSPRLGARTRSNECWVSAPQMCRRNYMHWDCIYYCCADRSSNYGTDRYYLLTPTSANCRGQI
jgi:hypothetical protein